MRYICIFLVAFMSNPAGAQIVRPSKGDLFVYTDVQVGPGTASCFDARLNCLFLQHHEISIGYTTYWQRARNIPYDYHTFDLFNTGTTYPQETLDGASISYAYVLYPRKRPDLVRYLLRGGILVGNYTDVQNFEPASSWFGPNYYYDRESHFAAGFTAEATMEYTATRYFGFTVSAYGVVNPEGVSGAGVKAGVLLGKVGNHIHIRRHHHHRK